MDIAVVLGLHHGGSQLQAAEEAWRSWVGAEPLLPDLPLLLDVPAWTRAQPPERTDEVLLVLARLGAPDGGGDPAAVAALAWLLLPGARRLAGSLGGGRYVEDVAAQLWLECLLFPWRRLRRVAANVLGRVRRAVVAQYGLGEVLLDPTDPQRWETATRWPPAQDPAAVPRRDELSELLEHACRAERIGAGEVRLLRALADAAAASRYHPRPPRGGLMGAAVAEQLGAELGLSARTVRRRASAALRVLHELAGERADAQPAGAGR